MNARWIRRISVTGTLLAATTFGVAGTAQALPRDCAAINRAVDQAYDAASIYYSMAQIWEPINPGRAFSYWMAGDAAWRRAVKLDSDSGRAGC
jgi:hypothetical protein